MKAYFIKPVRQEHSVFLLDALRQAVRERFKIHHTDSVFSLNYDREDQFYFKTPEMIYWGRVVMTPLTYQEALKLEREFETVRARFQTRLCPVIFCPSLQSGAGILAAFKIRPYCFEYTLLKSESGTSLALKDINLDDPIRSAVPPSPFVGKYKPSTPVEGQNSRPPLLSRSEIAELLEISLESKRLNFPSST